MRVSKKGQVLILLVVLIPVLVVTLGIIFRSGRILLAHHQIQNHCNKVILDALEAQAKGLSALGQVNPWAKDIIDMRRQIDKLLLAAVLAPIFEPELIAAQKSLTALQKIVETTQSAITLAYLVQSHSVLLRPPPSILAGKIEQSFQPIYLLFPHAFHKSLRLHVVAQSGYESEVGPPLELDSDFSDRQIVKGTINIKTESFLLEAKWPKFEALQNMTVQCKAHIEMDNLESPWTVRLNPIEDNPSSKPHSPFQRFSSF